MRSRLVPCAGLTLVLLSAAPTAPAPAAVPRADLRAHGIGAAPARLAEGTRFAAQATVRNTGRARAGASTLRFYLTTDVARSLRDRRASRAHPRASQADVLLMGSRAVRPLTAGRRSPTGGAVRLEVPAGTPPGSYKLLACADDRGAVAERREHDNCVATARASRVAPGPSGDIQALSGLTPARDAEAEALVAPTVRQEWCTSKRPRALTAAAAVRSAEAFLRRTAGADALAGFARSPSHRTANAAQAAAAGAVAAGSPGGALAALLRAHRLEPREASHLINAAGVATAVGLPNEALAMLDGAARLDDRDRSPMGIPRQAVALVNRAQALVRTGRHADAVRALDAATGLAPELTEAHAVRAAADLCAGRDMRPALRRSERRPEQPVIPPHELPPGTPWIDDGTGEPGTLRRVPLPGTPLAAPGLVGVLQGWIDRDVAWLHERNAREGQLRASVEGRQVAPAERRRREAVLAAANAVHEAPDLQALQRAFSAELRKATAVREELFGTGEAPGRYTPMLEAAGEACVGAEDTGACITSEIRRACIPVTGGIHVSWIGHLQAALELARRHQAEYGRRVSGIAAHLAAPDAYELALMAVADNERGLLALVVQEAHTWSGTLHGARDSRDVHHCVETPEPPPAGVDAAAPAIPAGPGACRGDVKDFNIVVPLPVLTLKANCEGIALEASSAGWIAAFAEVKLDMRGNRITVFGGAKGEVGFGPVKGDFKSGLYLTGGADGIEDVGWRVGPSRSVAVGALEWNPSDMKDMSFVGALAPEV